MWAWSLSLGMRVLGNNIGISTLNQLMCGWVWSSSPGMWVLGHTGISTVNQLMCRWAWSLSLGMRVLGNTGISTLNQLMCGEPRPREIILVLFLKLSQNPLEISLIAKLEVPRYPRVSSLGFTAAGRETEESKYWTELPGPSSETKMLRFLHFYWLFRCVFQGSPRSFVPG